MLNYQKTGKHNYIEESKNMIIANPNGSRKYMLFAKSKECIYAFTIKEEDVVLVKEGKWFSFFRVYRIYADDGADWADCHLIENYVDLKKMPFEYREMALALLQKEKTPQKACYFVGKNQNNENSVAEKMIKKLISYKNATKNRKIELVQELIADISAL